MPSVGISLSFPMNDAGRELLDFLMVDEGFDPKNPQDQEDFTGVYVRNCLIKYKNMCQIIEKYNLTVFMENIDRVKAAKSPRGLTWVVLAVDTDEPTNE